MALANDYCCTVFLVYARIALLTSKHEMLIAVSREACLQSTSTCRLLQIGVLTEVAFRLRNISLNRCSSFNNTLRTYVLLYRTKTDDFHVCIVTNKYLKNCSLLENSS